MNAAAAITFYLYIAVGIVFAVANDRFEMKKPVPFGELPALLPLHTLRKIVFAAFVVGGGFFLVRAFIKSFSLDVQETYQRWLLKRAIHRCVKKFGFPPKATKALTEKISTHVTDWIKQKGDENGNDDKRCGGSQSG